MWPFAEQVHLPIAPDLLTDLRTAGLRLLTVTGDLLHDDSLVLRVITHLVADVGIVRLVVFRCWTTSPKMGGWLRPSLVLGVAICTPLHCRDTSHYTNWHFHVPTRPHQHVWCMMP